jgi:hypothetical protein
MAATPRTVETAGATVETARATVEAKATMETTMETTVETAVETAVETTGTVETASTAVLNLTTKHLIMEQIKD